MKRWQYPDRDAWEEIARRPSRPSLEMVLEVEPILNAVREQGDAALREYTRKFDDVAVDDLRVSANEIAGASAKVGEELRHAIDVAVSNIDRFHRECVTEEAVVETMPGVRCWRKSVPIGTVGLYVPGGSAPLFSTVLMLGIPASIAGCPRVVLVTPPDRGGRVHPAILHSAHRVGIKEVYRVGGAQAIAALAFGTESIPRVDKIFGPGNQYVTAAKQLAALNGTAIDMPAGPTEVAIIADDSCEARFTAADILAQAEHGPDSHILFLSDDADYVESVLGEVRRQVADLPRRAIAEASLEHGHAVTTRTTDDALDLADFYAPEHLIIATRDADRCAD
ncbi:MAG: histidinol dehydrogenase, partial [Rhodothermales bacterium]|nr:histidinol dehydrogenase [Rhodothermales bacterium]